MKWISIEEFDRIITGLECLDKSGDDEYDKLTHICIQRMKDKKKKWWGI
jgi:hypothetical protein